MRPPPAVRCSAFATASRSPLPLSLAQDYSFPFDLLDGINRHTTYKKASYRAGKINRSSFNTQHFETAVGLLAGGMSAHEITNKYPVLRAVMGDMKSVGQMLRGSVWERHKFKHTLRGLQVSLLRALLAALPPWTPGYVLLASLLVPLSARRRCMGPLKSGSRTTSRS